MKSVALALLVALPAAAQAPRYRSEYFVTPDSVRIRYLVQGSGAPVILIHGFALSAELNWVAPGAMDSLAASCMVIAMDLRGHGRSDKPHEVEAYGTILVADVVALMNHLKIQRAHVAGYSLGAVLALRLVAAHPDRVLTTTLGGGGWHPPGVPPPPFFETWLTGLDRASKGEMTVSDALVRADMPAIPPPLRVALDANDAAALAAALRTVSQLTLPEADVRAIKSPVLAVVGDQDPARVVVDRLRATLPGLTVTVIPGADHGAAMRHPRLALAIRDFVRAH